MDEYKPGKIDLSKLPFVNGLREMVVELDNFKKELITARDKKIGELKKVFEVSKKVWPNKILLN